MFFEIFNHDGNLIIRGNKVLNTFDFTEELNLAPSLTMDLEIDWLLLLNGREEVKIWFREDKVFWGIIWDITVDKDAETISLDIRHVITEWQYRQISVNHAMSNKNLNIVYKGDEVEKSKTNDESITASNFTVLDSKIDKMKTSDWVKKAVASAWVTSTGDKVKITKVDHSKIKKEDGSYEDGTYKVTFSTAKGTSVTVDCEVVSAVEYHAAKTKSSKSNNETISARPFDVYVDKGYTASTVKKKVKAKAWVYRHTDQEVKVTSITTDFVNEVGTYEVTARTAKGTSITVKVRVTEGDSYSNVSEPAVVDKLEDIYSDMNFAYPGWQIDFQDESGTEMIDYVYSKQNKLEALTQTMELTDDLWWRVGLWNEKTVQIGKFGEKKPYILSKKPSGKTNIRILTDPTIDYDFENVVNVATVYSDKSDGGMSSLTLREAYMDEKLLEDGVITKRIQKDGFPVVILRANVNNERDYSAYVDQFPTIAPNNELEYAVIDEESVALESGIIIEGSYNFNDMSPFQTEGKNITDKKRCRAARTVYNRTVKKLIQARRSYDFIVTTEELPSDLYVGDRIRFLYDNKVLKLEACSSYFKKLLELDDWFYITRISRTYDGLGVEVAELTLTKWLKIQRETYNTQG